MSLNQLLLNIELSSQLHNTQLSSESHSYSDSIVIVFCVALYTCYIIIQIK